MNVHSSRRMLKCPHGSWSLWRSDVATGGTSPYLNAAAGRIKVLKQHFGDLPVKALEGPANVNRFKTESEYSRRVEISTLHKVLAVLVPPSAGGRRRHRRSSTSRPFTASPFG